MCICAVLHLDQTMTEAEHNRPIPKLFDSRPSASDAEVYCEIIRPIVSQKLWLPKLKLKADYQKASESADYVRLWSFSDSMHIVVQ